MLTWGGVRIVKVCMLAYSFFENDARMMQYATALTERGDQVDVIALRRGNAPSYEELNGVHVYRPQAREVNERARFAYLLRILRFMAVSAVLLFRLCRQQRYDVIHVHSVPDFLVFAALPTKLLGARIVLDIHDILPEFYASKFRISQRSAIFKCMLLCERISAACADHMIVANDIWHDRLITRSVRPEKCTTIRNYPDPAIFTAHGEARQQDRFLILYPGTLNRHQGLDVAIRAFALVADEMPGAVFHIYGEGSERESLQALIETLHLQQRVSLLDFLPIQQVARIMEQADLAVVPKRVSSSFGNEAASTKIMEFMSLGVPVIVSRTRIDSLYFDDSMVRFVEPENETELARAIYDLWLHPEVRKQMTENAADYLEENNWNRQKREYLRILDALLPASKKK
jgi:glycosyltransferase involved in cell wall biosynthesis